MHEGLPKLDHDFDYNFNSMGGFCVMYSLPAQLFIISMTIIFILLEKNFHQLLDDGSDDDDDLFFASNVPSTKPPFKSADAVNPKKIPCDFASSDNDDSDDLFSVRTKPGSASLPPKPPHGGSSGLFDSDDDDLFSDPLSLNSLPKATLKSTKPVTKNKKATFRY